MTTSQMLVLLGAIWIAPHCRPFVSMSIGLCYIIFAACNGMGWL